MVEPVLMIPRTAIFFACLISAAPLHAASSDVFTTQGGSVKLVTSGLSDAEGKLRGALQIHLEPGWKTYWRDPGATGIPPQIAPVGTGIQGVEILYPAPERFEDSYGDWAGYGKSVTFPVVFHTSATNTAPLIEAEVMLGICQTICIPVQASFTFDASAGAEDQRDAFNVQSAFAALPTEPRADFRVNTAEAMDDDLSLTVQIPVSNTKPELFVTAEGGQITLPDLKESNDGTATFSARVLKAPRPDTLLHYTLVQDGAAVAGTIPFPTNRHSIGD